MDQIEKKVAEKEQGQILKPTDNIGNPDNPDNPELAQPEILI